MLSNMTAIDDLTSEGLYFYNLPAMAETPNMRHEGETSASPPPVETKVSPWRRTFDGTKPPIRLFSLRNDSLESHVRLQPCLRQETALRKR